jgi:hypothetical protein
LASNGNRMFMIGVVAASGGARIALESHKTARLMFMRPESGVYRARRVTGRRCALNR